MENKEYETITRCDGITYKRAKRNYNFDCNLNIKFYKEKIEKLKVIAERLGTNYNQLVRDLIDDLIKQENI